MDSSTFELHSSTPPETPKEFRQKSHSTFRIFLICFFASILTTALGILILSLIFRDFSTPKIPQNWDFHPSEESQEKIPKVDPKFGFLYHLGKSKIYKYPGGEIQWGRFREDFGEYESQEASEFGRNIHRRRSGMSLGKMRIRRRGLRAPHWNWDGNEHGYLEQGSARVGILGPDSSEVTTFEVSQGQVVFFPKNSVVWVKNVGEEDLILVVFYSTHEELKSLELDEAFFGLSEDVAARALQPEGGVEFIRTFQKAKEEQKINLPENLGEIIRNCSFQNSPESQKWRFFYDLKGSKEFPFPGGVFQWARVRKNGSGLSENEQIYSKSLQEHENSLTLATLRIFGNHLGQPHFHFNANEMGIVLSGCGQAGLTLPSSSLTFPIGIGDVFFFPSGSQHFLQSFCQEDLVLLLAYSTNSQLQTLRINQYFRALPDSILAQLFSKDQKEFQKIPKPSP